MLDNLADTIVAVGALGTAAYALVDGSKAVRGGISNIGFRHIKRSIERLCPAGNGQHHDPLSRKGVLETLQANWINGRPLADQKAVAKSLVKLRLNKENAEFLAKATGVDKTVLISVAAKIQSGHSLSQQETDAFGRFDLILTAQLDEGYQRADQAYRNSAKAWSAFVAVVLALAGGWVLWDQQHAGDVWSYWLLSKDLFVALLLGVLATPLAPVSKDLATAINTAVGAMKSVKK